jgi:hypothetical protein
MESVLTEILQFLEVRKEIIPILKKMESEIDVAAKNASHANLDTKVVSRGADITSAVCVGAAPFTAGASAPVAAGMTVLSGTSAVGVTVVKYMKESGLMNTASEVIEKDQRAKERLQAAAKSIIKLQTVTVHPAQLLHKAVEVGLITTKKLNAVFKLSGNAKETAIETEAAKVFGKVDKVAKFVRQSVFVRIPLEIMDIVVELLEAGNVSEAIKEMDTKITDLQNEYQTVGKQYDEIKSALIKKKSFAQKLMPKKFFH